MNKFKVSQGFKHKAAEGLGLLLGSDTLNPKP